MATGYWSHRCVELVGRSAGGPAPAHFWFHKQVEEFLEAVEEVSHAVFGGDLRNQLFFPFFPYMQFPELWPEERSSKYPKSRKARRWRRIPKPLLIVTSTGSGKPWWMMRVWKKSAKCARSKVKSFKSTKFFLKKPRFDVNNFFGKWKATKFQCSILEKAIPHWYYSYKDIEIILWINFAMFLVNVPRPGSNLAMSALSNYCQILNQRTQNSVTIFFFLSYYLAEVESILINTLTNCILFFCVCSVVNF